MRIRDGVVDSEWNNCDPEVWDAEFLHHFLLHFSGVNKQVVGESILGAQCKTIQACIFAVSLIGIDVVGGENYLFAQTPVVKHQEGPVEELESVVPQD